MERHQFNCFVCGYRVETSGPYPFFVDANNMRQPYPSPPPMLANGRERGFDGLYAEMYCNLCDRPTTAIISQFYSPVSAEQLASGETDSMVVAEPACSGCGNRNLLYGQGSVDCPHCHQGRLLLPSDRGDRIWSQEGQPVVAASNEKATSKGPDYLSGQSEAKTALRRNLLIAWIPFTLLAALFSLAAVNGVISACYKPDQDLAQFCSGPWQYLALLASLGPIVFIGLAGYTVLRSDKERLWPLLLGLIAAFISGALAMLR